MLVVNIFGAPSAGKSVMQGDLFCKLKKSGVKADIITEKAKALTYEERWNGLICQPYLFGNTFYDMKMMEPHLDVLVLDSPLLLCNLYGRDEPSSFHQMVYDYSSKFNNLNYFLRRSHAYQTAGRRQSESESDILSSQCLEMLDKWDIDFSMLPSGEYGLNLAFEQIMTILSDNIDH